ncbi:MAG: bifunctional DNA-formamidopyrimidine glycosylase/DNA-(apurinic or apyrimidinic site) lyase [Phycisphaerae bacterium]
MPELPEVETIVRMYRPRLEGRAITRFVSRWAKHAEPSVAAVRRGIVGKRIGRLRRRAKYIVADLEASPGATGGLSASASAVPPHGQTSLPTARGARDRYGRGHVARQVHGHLLIHLRMSGRFEWAAEHEREPEHVGAYFDLDDGNRLLFCDTRKFGKIIYTADFEAATSHLGIEPLERSFTSAALAKVLQGRARQLKPLLLDQSVVAGLGNIYTDEALFQARLHPTRRSDRLTSQEARRLRAAIQSVLRKAIRHQGTSFDGVYRGGGMRRYLNVYGRAGLPCRRCKTPIEALRIAQRGTHVCPKCQPLDGTP